MENTFAIGVKVKILGKYRDDLKGRTGVIIKDVYKAADHQPKFGRKLGEPFGSSTEEKAWIVKLYNTDKEELLIGAEILVPEVDLEIIT